MLTSETLVSSLLKRFAPDPLKIDSSFVRDIETDPGAQAIVIAMIRMAEGLHYDIVAEGIETVGQLEFLIKNGCRGVQGHLMSPAIAPEMFGEWFRGNQANATKAVFGVHDEPQADANRIASSN